MDRKAASYAPDRKLRDEGCHPRQAELLKKAVALAYVQDSLQVNVVANRGIDQLTPLGQPEDILRDAVQSFEQQWTKSKPIELLQFHDIPESCRDAFSQNYTYKYISKPPTEAKQKTGNEAELVAKRYLRFHINHQHKQPSSFIDATQGKTPQELYDIMAVEQCQFNSTRDFDDDKEKRALHMTVALSGRSIPGRGGH